MGMMNGTIIISITFNIILSVVSPSSVYAYASPELSPNIAPDVLIDVGHGGIDGGAKHGPWLEKDINLTMSKLLEKSLNQHHIRAVSNRKSDMALSDDNHWLNNRSRHIRDLAQRKLMMEQLHPQIIISLHCNWARNPSRHGPITLHQSNQGSFTLANVVQSHLNSLYHTNHATYYGRTFYLLKHAPTPTIIIEMGFISNPADLEMLTSKNNQLKIVEAITSAIWEYLLILHIDQAPEAT